MYFDKSTSLLKWAVIGGILGGAIAIIGYWILSPATDSVALFVLLRVVIGAIVAMVAGPIIASRLTKNR